MSNVGYREDMIQAVVELVATMNTDERVGFIGALCSRFCAYCGVENEKGKPCQCSNDE